MVDLCRIIVTRIYHGPPLSELICWVDLHIPTILQVDKEFMLSEKVCIFIQNVDKELKISIFMIFHWGFWLETVYFLFFSGPSRSSGRHAVSIQVVIGISALGLHGH